MSPLERKARGYQLLRRWLDIATAGDKTPGTDPVKLLAQFKDLRQKTEEYLDTVPDLENEEPENL